MPASFSPVEGCWQALTQAWCQVQMDQEVGTAESDAVEGGCLSVLCDSLQIRILREKRKQPPGHDQPFPDVVC